MLINFWPATEEVWIPILSDKIEEGADDVESVQEILARFEIAEMDYLCTRIHAFSLYSFLKWNSHSNFTEAYQFCC